MPLKPVGNNNFSRSDKSTIPINIGRTQSNLFFVFYEACLKGIYCTRCFKDSMGYTIVTYEYICYYDHIFQGQTPIKINHPQITLKMRHFLLVISMVPPPQPFHPLHTYDSPIRVYTRKARRKIKTNGPQLTGQCRPAIVFQLNRPK